MTVLYWKSMLQQKPHMELRKYDLYFVCFDQEIRLLQ